MHRMRCSAVPESIFSIAVACCQIQLAELTSLSFFATVFGRFNFTAHSGWKALEKCSKQ
jgi:hypothetical protein